MVMHIVSESGLPVFLLLAGHVSVSHLLHDHDFLLLGRHHHEHPSGKISAAEGVLPVEREGFEVGHIGVEQDEGNVPFVQYVGKGSGHVESGWHHDDPVHLFLQALFGHLDKGVHMEPSVIKHLHLDIKVSSMHTGLHGSLFYFLPIGFRGMFGNDTIEGVRLIVSQGAGIHVGLVVHLLESLLHLLLGC